MYHWRLTKRELASLYYTDFNSMVTAYNDVEKKRLETDRINSARIAWLMGSDSGTTFQKFCEKYGVVEVVKKEVEVIDTKKLYDFADKITTRLKQNGT